MLIAGASNTIETGSKKDKNNRALVQGIGPFTVGQSVYFPNIPDKINNSLYAMHLTQPIKKYFC